MGSRVGICRQTRVMSCKSYAEHTWPNSGRIREDARSRKITAYSDRSTGHRDHDLSEGEGKRAQKRKRNRNSARVPHKQSSETSTEKKLRDSSRERSSVFMPEYQLVLNVPARSPARSRVQTKSIPMETSIKYERTCLFHVSLRVHAREPASSRTRPDSFPQIPQEFLSRALYSFQTTSLKRTTATGHA